MLEKMLNKLFMLDNLIAKFIKSEKLRKIINQEVIYYCIVGALTTIVCIGSFKLFEDWFKSENWFGEKAYAVANFISIVIAILFAFIPNKLLVFRSTSWKSSVVAGELVSFALARVFSLFLDMGCMILFVSYIHMNSLAAKAIVQVIVVAVNYILSKLWIFRKKK